MKYVSSTILLLIFVASAQANNLERSVAILKAWEAKFNHTKIFYVRDIDPDNKYSLEVWPGVSILRKHSSQTNVLVSYYEGLVWYGMPQGSSYKYAKVYGTELEQNVSTYKYWSRELLQGLIVYLSGELKVSQALQFGSHPDCKVLTPSRLKWTFSPPSNAGFVAGTTIALTIDTIEKVPKEVNISSPNRASSVKRLIKSKGKLAFEIFELDSTKLKRVGGVKIQKTEPLLNKPTQFEPAVGELIDDRAMGVDYPYGTKRNPISSKIVADTIRKAKLGQLVVASGNDRRLLCGPDCLTYMLHLQGKFVDTSKVFEQFGDTVSGTTLGAIKDVGNKLGGSFNVYNSSAKSIQSIQTPFLASIRPAHFVVVVSFTRDKVTVINPPDGVQTLPMSYFLESWTGYYVK